MNVFYTGKVILLYASFATFVTSCNRNSFETGCQFPNDEEYQLVWADEFDGTSLNLDYWSYEIGDGCDREPSICGWGNNELQTYTDSPNNVRVQDGKLIIEARRETPALNGREFSSGRIITKNKADWRYGKFEIRAKMPIGRGLWPAIWMMPTESVYGIWPASGEIDIMEYLGHEPNRIFGTIHWGLNRWGFRSQYYDSEEINFSQTFHTYTCIWNENCILFQVDGRDIGIPNDRSTPLPEPWPFDQLFHMILNVAVGGNLPGNPDGSTTFPQTMEVDYVRVYQKVN
ncbi:MAG: glycoside hydrolase family 16 protein [Luteibaculaceae bacterium]